MGYLRVFTATLPALVLANLVLGSAAAYGGPLAFAVEREIEHAFDSAVNGGRYQFPSEPLVAAVLDRKNKPLYNTELTAVAQGLAAVYRKRDPNASEVIIEQGDMVRQALARFLIDLQAFTRASEPDMVVEAFVKFLSLEPSEPTRSAVLTALRTVDPVSLGKIAQGLKLLADKDVDAVGVLRNEVLRSRNSLEEIIKTVFKFNDCGGVLAFSKTALAQPASP